jgi:hypothetical protein
MLRGDESVNQDAGLIGPRHELPDFHSKGGFGAVPNDREFLAEHYV